MILNPSCQSPAAANGLWQPDKAGESAARSSHFLCKALHSTAQCVRTQQAGLISSHFLNPLWRYFSCAALNCSYLEQFTLSASFIPSTLSPISEMLRTKEIILGFKNSPCRIYLASNVCFFSPFKWSFLTLYFLQPQPCSNLCKQMLPVAIINL